MKIRISEPEWGGIYSFSEDDGDFTEKLIEVPDEKYKEWQKIMEQFDSLQMELSNLCNQKG